MRKGDRSSYKVSSNEAAKLIIRYVRRKLTEQIKSVSVIILYLLAFQTIVLGIPVLDASVIALGMMMVILGLAFFMEGLLLGIMPMGEEIGIRLPQKAKVGSILFIAFVLGLVSTYAEPAIGVLKAAGTSVLAWRAPLLFLILNKYSSLLVMAVGFGVGLALILGMYRFLKGWSLKPYIYILISILLSLSLYSYLDPNLRHILGLAWDCGGGHYRARNRAFGLGPGHWHQSCGKQRRRQNRRRIWRSYPGLTGACDHRANLGNRHCA
ncbi:MAG: DUF1538 domain-containing protein [Candidatus Cloacimonetes bacterium]|nr:DUF1538 domain-containing protein [Candidatus Cloacimonadota bacterium]